MPASRSEGDYFLNSELFDSREQKFKRLFYQQFFDNLNSGRIAPGQKYSPNAFWTRFGTNFPIEKVIGQLTEIPGIRIQVSEKKSRRGSENFIIIFDLKKVLSFLENAGAKQKAEKPIEIESKLVGGEPVSQFDQFLPYNSMPDNGEDVT